MILPDLYHDGDHRWLTEQFDTLSGMADPRQVQKVAIQYSAVYKDERDKEPNNVKKENVARREANTRLRRYIENLRGRVVAPPKR